MRHHDSTSYRGDMWRQYSDKHRKHGALSEALLTARSKIRKNLSRRVFELENFGQNLSVSRKEVEIAVKTRIRNDRPKNTRSPHMRPTISEVQSLADDLPHKDEVAHVGRGMDGNPVVRMHFTGGATIQESRW